MAKPSVTGRSVNRAELASICGVSLPTIDAWVRRGCPVRQRGSKGREWEFNSAAVIDWRIEEKAQDVAATLQGESGLVAKEEADRRKAVANAITAEVAADEALRMVVSREDATADLTSFCQVLKSGLSNAAAKIASRATTITNAAEIEEMSQAELNRAFRSAREELLALWLGRRDDDDSSGED